MSRDFSYQQYHGPLFPEKRRGSGVSFFLFAAFLTGIGWALLGITTPWLFIETVHINGLKYLSADVVQKAVNVELDKKQYAFFPARHRFFVREEGIVESLKQTFSFDAVRIVKKGSTLSVTVREKPTGVLLFDGERAVFADLSGILTRTATDQEKRFLNPSMREESPFLILRVETKIQQEFGAQVFTQDFLSRFDSLRSRFPVETGLSVQAYIAPRLLVPWIKIQLVDGRDIYFDLMQDQKTQIEKLLTLLKEKPEKVKNVSYIDVRYPDRIYYK